MLDAFFCAAVTMAALFIFLKPVGNFEDKRSTGIAGFLLAAAGVSGFWLFGQRTVFGLLFIPGLLVLRAALVRVLSHEGWKECFYISIWSGMVAGIVTQAAGWIGVFFERIFLPKPLALFLETVLAVVFLALIVQIFLADTMPVDGHYHIGPRQITLAFVEYALFGVLRMGNSLFRGADAQIFMALTLFTSEVMLLVILYLEYTMFRNSAMQKEITTMNLLWHEQKAQYDLAKENIELINRKCHDLKHQIRALRGENGRISDPKYLDEIASSINIYESIVKTGSDVLDTILTEKSLLCREKEIKINCVADGAQLAFMDPVDLYSVFGNAIDNSIEEVLKFEEKEKRQIDVVIFRKESLISAEIVNPVKDVPEFSGGLPLTTKGDNGYHGFGVKSIKSTIEKYGGFVVIDTSGGCFALKMLLPAGE
ncbi:MAG: GHKL domain-containing protein [Lachnospiraceae bacterium]|nr:GHKL domain-containing protein [Lachnospiraceae bacterium]